MQALRALEFQQPTTTNKRMNVNIWLCTKGRLYALLEFKVGRQCKSAKLKIIERATMFAIFLKSTNLKFKV